MLGLKIQTKQDTEIRKDVVNKAVKICIECGNLAVKIDNYGIYCNNCNSSFQIKEEKIGV